MKQKLEQLKNGKITQEKYDRLYYNCSINVQGENIKTY